MYVKPIVENETGKYDWEKLSLGVANGNVSMSGVRTPKSDESYAIYKVECSGE